MANRFAQLVSLLTPKRRWLQFRLATMLVAVTAFCLWLGDYVNPIRRRERQLRDPNEEQRVFAAERLGYLGSDARSATVVPGLIDRLDHERPEVRKAAAEQLPRLGESARQAAPALRARLHDADPAVSAATAAALGAVDPEDDEFLAVLKHALHSDDVYHGCDRLRS